MQFLHAVPQQKLIADPVRPPRPVQGLAARQEQPQARPNGKQFWLVEQPGDLGLKLVWVPYVVVRSEERRVGKEGRWRYVRAEDGIRDWSVTGVQTCALPIYAVPSRGSAAEADS